MSNFNTLKDISDNLETALRKEGINFSKKAYDEEKSIPAPLIPFGRIFYSGESFEHNEYGSKPGYGEAEFLIKVTLQEKDPPDMMAAQQKWGHKIREAVTVNSLNTGGLLQSKLVSRVTTKGIGVENKGNYSNVNYRLSVRYREV